VNYLIDTNIISEVRKGPRCDPIVAAWFAGVEDREIYLSVLVIGEIRRGIERERSRDPVKSGALERWLQALTGSYSDRILPIDQAIAEEWGRMSARRSVPLVDALLAATAKVHRMRLVTRNVPDIADLGADFLDPFEPDR
jgi:predicted nucleic acid-binding protein